MRSVPESMDGSIVAVIDARLEAVGRDQGVEVAWAVESGSRAWGFPSPDSDYDCRFLYVRPRADYLSPWSVRDVIETPLDPVYDVNGWDLAKALRLLVKGNATVGEWLRSPIVYRGSEPFAAGLLEVAGLVVDRGLLGRHHLHVALGQWTGGSGTPALKRTFYALRPAMTLRWLDQHPAESVPPMDLPSLLATTETPVDVVAATEELTALKARTRELGRARPPAVLADFIRAELERAAERYERVDPVPREEARAIAADFFRSVVG